MLRANDPNWSATWLTMLLPFIEQSNLYNQYNFSNTAVSQSTVTKQAIPMLRCPSNPGSSTNFNSVGDFAKGTYGACIQVDDAWSTIDSPFAHVVGSNTNDVQFQKLAAFNMGFQYGANISEFSDGTSNTVVVAEIMTMPNAGDVRGAWGHPAGSYFSVNYDGNANSSDAVRYPNIPAALSGAATTGIDYPTWCGDDTLVDARMGCGDGSVSPYTYDSHIATRSWHVGGTQVLMGDGAVRFMSENIDRGTWAALCSIRGHETLGEY